MHCRQRNLDAAKSIFLLCNTFEGLKYMKLKLHNELKPREKVVCHLKISAIIPNKIFFKGLFILMIEVCIVYFQIYSCIYQKLCFSLLKIYRVAQESFYTFIQGLARREKYLVGNNFNIIVKIQEICRKTDKF